MYIQFYHIAARLKLIQHPEINYASKKKSAILWKPASGLKVWLKASFLGPGDRMLCQRELPEGAETFTRDGPVLGDRYSNDATGKSLLRSQDAIQGTEWEGWKRGSGSELNIPTRLPKCCFTSFPLSESADKKVSFPWKKEDYRKLLLVSERLYLVCEFCSLWHFTDTALQLETNTSIFIKRRWEAQMASGWFSNKSERYRELVTLVGYKQELLFQQWLFKFACWHEAYSGRVS